jgi:YVTN family beta-propeller protein
MNRNLSAVTRCWLVFTVLALTPGVGPAADELDRLPIGVQPDGRIVVPTNQILTPAGRQIPFPGRPVDLAFADDGRTLVVKNRRDLVFIDVPSLGIKQVLELPKKEDPRPGFGVVGLVVQDERVYAGDAQGQVRVAKRMSDGNYEWAASIKVPRPRLGGLPNPAGIAPDSTDLFWVASTRANSILQINARTYVVEQEIEVGVCPYAICRAAPDRYYISNWGGDPPGRGEPQDLSSGSPIRVDPKTGIASSGTISVLERMGAPSDGIAAKWRQRKTIHVGLHPSGMALSPKHRFLYVANANSDTISVIDTKTDEVVESISCRPVSRLPFGSGANAVAVSPNGAMLYAANGTNNCVAVIRLGAASSEDQALSKPAQSRMEGLIPTGWYPGAILASRDGKTLVVANVKGHGALSQPRAVVRGKNSHDHLGTVSVIEVPDGAQLERYTRQVNENNRLSYSLAGLDKPRLDAKPVCVPARHGEPSVFEHVIYIIKENRTYDQVFGDVKEGNGDPNLVMFGEGVTPNHHALARQFTLFDNFYCSGVLSADGHQWVNEAYVTDYLEKSFGGFTRSYPDDGSDPLAYASSGFLWDNALAHKKTFRNYGEFVNPEYVPEGTTWSDIYRDFKSGANRINFNVRANLPTLAPYTHPRYPWFPLLAPDIYRAKVFIEELRTYERKGTLPNLIYATLPCNHTAGTRPTFPTPRSMVADNDLALGQIVEAVTHSRFWPKTCILVVEDDPQNGFDHVDGHRTVALAISPYTRRRFVDHTCYNQTGMVKTIELMLGLPPMNQLDLSATAMRNCFQEQPDLSGYTCLPNRIPLDEMNPPVRVLRGQALHWAKKSLALDLDEGDQADEDTLNRILWHATRGEVAPYPEQFVNRRAD